MQFFFEYYINYCSNKNPLKALFLRDKTICVKFIQYTVSRRLYKSKSGALPAWLHPNVKRKVYYKEDSGICQVIIASNFHQLSNNSSNIQNLPITLLNILKHRITFLCNAFFNFRINMCVYICCGTHVAMT